MATTVEDSQHTTVYSERFSSAQEMWSFEDEPHASRRKMIIAKYPQIKNLMRPDNRIIIQIVASVILQVIAAYIAASLDIRFFLLMAYVFGGTINHSLSLGMHELSHYTAFGASRILPNHLFALICNLPLGVPAAFTFQKYHADHHRYLGDEILDTDIPSALEIRLFATAIGKFFFILLQPLSYCLRPFFVNPKMITFMEIVNWAVQILFDVLILKAFGKWSLIYLLLSTVFGLSLHPISGHFISEHYVFIHGYETYSYYGPLNWITFNVGYHNEHHDFPCIPGYKLPEKCGQSQRAWIHAQTEHSLRAVLYYFVSVECAIKLELQSLLSPRKDLLMSHREAVINGRE